MGRPEAVHRLVVNADDFGRSHPINEAVIRAHQRGILTSASLMVNGEAADEAVGLAREHPRLGVGLHLTLTGESAAVEPGAAAGRVEGNGRFSEGPVRAGMRYFFRRSLRPELEREIAAQFRRFRDTGLTLDHVNGHWHIHLHPTIFGILMRHHRVWGITHMRLTRDLFWLNVRLASGRWIYRSSHALLFSWLAILRARPVLRRNGIRHTSRVFGLLQDSRVDEGFVLRLLPRLPGGDSELYSHPSLDAFRHELDALVSPRVKARVQELGIDLIRYQDL